MCLRPSPVMCVQNIQPAEWWGKIRVLVSSTTSNSIAAVNASSAIFCMCVRARLTSPDFLSCVFKTLNLMNSEGKRRVLASTGTNFTVAVNVSSMILCVRMCAPPVVFLCVGRGVCLEPSIC